MVSIIEGIPDDSFDSNIPFTYSFVSFRITNDKMAHVGALPGLQRIVTTHNSEGKAIIDKSIDIDAPFDGAPQGGKAAFMLGYTTTQFPPNLNEDADIKIYKNFLEKPPGLVSGNGTVLRVVVSRPSYKTTVKNKLTSLEDCAPDTISPMHRTVSLDYGVVLMGDIELVLDSGETRAMKVGDICVQRGTMHAWRNTSQTEWARMLYVLQPCQPVIVNGEELKEDYGDMVGVPKSS